MPTVVLSALYEPPNARLGLNGVLLSKVTVACGMPKVYVPPACAINAEVNVTVVLPEV